ncbi:hypothetical protein ACFOLG_12150 [Vogesella facilis]|uniref:Uncharacterized protein n=1 Tax=Vogesella facilis TaxID=1655232 RepID=A0ABV7RF43_9NEIS
MTTDRRTLLKGLAAVGLAFTGGSLAHAASGLPDTATLAAGSQMPLTAVVSGSAVDRQFLAGVSAAAQQHGMQQQPALSLNGLDGSLLQHIHTLAQDTQPAMLVGLVDDATATVLLDLVRSAGGRVLAQQHQRLNSDATAQQLAATLGHELVRRPATVAAATAGSGVLCVSFCCVI